MASAKAVRRAFGPLVEEQFAFLVDEHGLPGPVRDDRVLPGVEYGGPDAGWSVVLDDRAGHVGSRAWVRLDGRVHRADVAALGALLGLGHRLDLPDSARTLYELRRAVHAQAAWARRVQPELTANLVLEAATRR